MILELVYNMRKKLTKTTAEADLNDYYVRIINLSRVVFIYIIQLLYDHSM
jgi:hypothetical protein